MPAPHVVAALVCALASLTLLWPLLTGQILFGGGNSDMFIAGYSFRGFAAEHFLATGEIPQWNPYLFGGLPYIGAMHGDIFYPTAWLRWIMPVDLAITWGMVVHFVLAGWFCYRFACALGLSWGAALVAGVAYELTGIVASQMSPGHDGKLFVSALTPLAFWLLLHTIRQQARWGYGAIALSVALIVLGHYHMAYFLLIAMGLWALYLVFWDPERPANGRPWFVLGGLAAAVVVALGITALQVLPFFEYIPFSPRAEGGPNTGWQFATSYALPPAELIGTILPQFNGLIDNYWGSNPIKLHTEYIGFLPCALAALAWGDRARRRLVTAFGAGSLLFLLFSFGGHTPFYRPFFELLPLLDKIRAMGMVFFLVAFGVAMLAGVGAGRVLAREVPLRTVLIVTGAFAAFALLGVTGALQGIADSVAGPERADAVQANAAELRSGSVRLLLVVALGGAVLWAMAAGRISRLAGTAGLVAVVAADLWSIDRRFYTFSPRADVLFADDAVTTHLKGIAPPYRVLEAGRSYSYSVLMAYRIPVALGYHGFELRAYDELGGKDEGWRNLFSPNLLDLLAIRFLILQEPRDVPGYHQVVPSTPTAFGTTAVLYERDSLPAWARVFVAAAQLPRQEIVPTLVDSRFPVSEVALFDDTTSVRTTATTPPFARSNVRATVTQWSPGRMTIALTGEDTTAGHLVVSENWYKDWHAEVDGKPATVRRADHALLSVDLPPGARDVRLTFASAAYARGKWISLVALLIALAALVAPMVRRRGTA